MGKKKSSSKRLARDFLKFEPNRRYFGRFLCNECKRHWQSSNVWLGYGQYCAVCFELVQPYELKSLDKMPFVDNNDLENHPTEMCERCVKFGIACFQSEGIDYYDLDHEQLIGQIDQTSGGDVTRRKDEHSSSMTKPKLQTDDKFQLLFPNEIINNYAKYLFWGGLIAFIGFNTFKRTS